MSPINTPPTAPVRTQNQTLSEISKYVINPNAKAIKITGEPIVPVLNAAPGAFAD